ncbi:MAG: hypothetical protein AB9883_03585 [Acidaminococcaceae bacterium]
MDAPKDVTEQTTASYVEHLNAERLKGLANDLQKIIEERESSMYAQHAAYASATEELKKLREVLGDPEHILGSLKTKHGEIAEFLQVYVTRAQDLVNQRVAEATFDGIERLAAADYTINGIEVQSKFINGMNNTLTHVIKHMRTYEYFGRDGSFYQIPKDQYESIVKLMEEGHLKGLNLNSQTAILNKAEEIQRLTKCSFYDVVRPGISNYYEVQQGVVFKTVDGHEQDIIRINNERMAEIREKAKADAGIAKEAHEPGLGEAGKAAGVGAEVAGALTLGLGIRKKIKEGKKLKEFTVEDWKELGVDTAYASAKGGITGASLYGLTNYTKMSAPVAAAFISASFGIVNLYKRYKKGEMEVSQLYEEAQLICVDSSIVALGATVGSMLIPVPGLGALMGSLVSSTAREHFKKILFENELREIERMDYEYQKYNESLDANLRLFIDGIIEKYNKMNGMIGIAFNYEVDVLTRFDASVGLAKELGIPDNEIIKTKPGLDVFLGY